MTPSELFAEYEALDNRIHTVQWRAAVEEARKRLDFCPGAESEIEGWLERYGLDKVVVEVFSTYTSLQADTHMPTRFFIYFLACVLSHHSGGTVHHTLPKSLLAPNLRRHYDMPDPYFRVWYTPKPPVPESTNWERAYAPLGFELCWPKSEFIRVATVYDASSGQIVKEVDVPQIRVFFEGPGKWSRFEIINYGFFLNGKAIEGRYIYGEPLIGRSIQEVYGLPPDALVVLTGARIPFASPPGLGVTISLGPGATMDEWLEPRLNRDISIQKWEKEIADMLEESIQKIWVNRNLQWKQGGRPLMEQAAPGMPYSERVEQLYRLYLSQERDTPQISRRRRLRDRARKQAQREYPLSASRDELPLNWWESIENEQPWKQKKRKS